MQTWLILSQQKTRRMWRLLHLPLTGSFSRKIHVPFCRIRVGRRRCGCGSCSGSSRGSSDKVGDSHVGHSSKFVSAASSAVESWTRCSSQCRSFRSSFRQPKGESYTKSEFYRIGSNSGGLSISQRLLEF